MPRRAPSPCNYPGCGELVAAGRGPCPTHKGVVRKAYDEARKRDPITRFYGSGRWKRLRRRKLDKTPLCEPCERDGRLTGADTVHHIIEIRDGGATMDFDNLESICRSCHARAHGRGGGAV